MLVTLLIAVVIFVLIWWAISILPMPANSPPHIKTVLYLVLIVAAIIYLLKYLPR